MSGKIVYTKTDEAPALATQSLLPILEKFMGAAGIEIELKDISLAGRILANLSEYLKPEQRVADALTELGNLAKTPEANIIKLPNISASVPQLKNAISELQEKGFPVPEYPEDPKSPEEEKIKKIYSKVLGSAVNPVLREGNSDRRVAKSVKNYAKNNPHSMGAWSSQSKSHVASMSEGDFYGSEQSVIINNQDTVEIVLINKQGQEKVLKKSFEVSAGEVLDSSVMSLKALKDFLLHEVADAKKQGVLFSVHLKATMMKVSDPIIFGQAVEAFYSSLFTKFHKELEEAGVDSRNGMGDLLKKIEKLPPSTQTKILEVIQSCYDEGPDLAMVDSDKGITNLHVPSDVIVDASMPAAIRSSGQMWNADGKLQDMKAVIPDRCYAAVYEKTIEFCKSNGAFDPRTMGSVANVGLMAQKAEEYGSHDKTFWIEEAGKVIIRNSSGQTLMSQDVEVGDIWRACQTKDIAIRDWVKLAVTRSRLSETPAYFWLDSARAHDANLIEKVGTYLAELDTEGLEIQVLSPSQATEKTLARVKAGEDTISVTGNVLRDYLTDLFPILELGTSAKMLSIVPLLDGGGLFETGAGGSAPKHVEQFVEENHLRWDSLGEFLAIAVSIEDLANKTKDKKTQVLATCLDQANEEFLKNNKSPSRKAKEIDNRGSHFYLCLYWAQALASQDENQDLKRKFTPLALQLKENEGLIMEELNDCQGGPVDLGGYYWPDDAKVALAMRPSITFNNLLNSF